MQGTYSVLDRNLGISMLVLPASREAHITVGSKSRPRDNIYDWIRKLSANAVRRLPEKVIDGHTVVGFVATQDEVSLRLEWTAWVDPRTDLPVQLEYEGWSTDGHAFTGTMRDIVFDGDVDLDRLRMQPPDGFTVTTNGLSTLPMLPKEKDLAAPELKPGVGLGPARFGVSRDEVIRLLGQPDITADNGKMLEYRSRGFTLRVSPVRGWHSVDCYGQEVREVIVRDFAGQTKEGIGLGASLSDLTAAFGNPEEAKKRKETPATIYALYPTLGLEFTLFQDRVVRFSMRSTTPPPKSTVKVEFRVAQNEPGEGLTEASVVGSARNVYLHKSSCVTSADIAEAAAAVDEHGQLVIDLVFTPKGAVKMKKLTSENLNRLLSVLIDGKLICAPRIIVPISRSARITGHFTEEEVARIVRGINGQTPGSVTLPKQTPTVRPFAKPQADINTTDGEVAQHMQSMRNLKQLGLAMHKYHDVHKRYPPAASYDASGKPLLSWRVHILPFLDQKALYDQFRLDEPWDSEHNKQFIPLIVKTFQNPEAHVKLGLTTYLVPIGKGTVFGSKESLRMQDIEDGTSCTLLIVSVTPDRSVPWTKPEDLPVTKSDPRKGLIGPGHSVFLTTLCDGTVRAISSATDNQTLWLLLDSNDQTPIDFDKVR